MKIHQLDVEIKQANFPSTPDLDAVYGLIRRVTNGLYASSILLEHAPDDGFDSFEVCDKDGKILIRASSGVAMASAFNAP